MLAILPVLFVSSLASNSLTSIGSSTFSGLSSLRTLYSCCTLFFPTRVVA